MKSCAHSLKHIENTHMRAHAHARAHAHTHTHAQAEIRPQVQKKDDWIKKTTERMIKYRIGLEQRPDLGFTY